MNLQNLPNVIAACGTLHNMCEIHKEQFNDEQSTNRNADNIPLDDESDPAAVSTTDASEEYICHTHYKCILFMHTKFIHQKNQYVIFVYNQHTLTGHSYMFIIQAPGSTCSGHQRRDHHMVASLLFAVDNRTAVNYNSMCEVKVELALQMNATCSS